MIIFSVIDFQLDIIEIGIIIVVSNIKYIDKPSIPKYILNNLYYNFLVQIEID